MTHPPTTPGLARDGERRGDGMLTARIINADCRDALRAMEAESVHCCVTSPPYFGLRSYLPNEHDDKALEIGLESRPDCLGWATGSPCGACFVCVMVDVFREVRRVLRPDGTLW